MAAIFYFILFTTGLLMVVKGSDWFVDSAVWAAEVFRIPSIIIGATIISICTTLPETFVSAAASLKEESVMAAGNALGSIGVNTGLLLSILLISTKPVIKDRKEFLQSCFFLALLLLLIWLIGLTVGEINMLIGIGLLVLFILYIIKNVVSARRQMDLDIQYDFVDENDIPHIVNPDMPEGAAFDEPENDINISFQLTIHKIIFFCIGIFLVIFGSNLLVDNGVHIAELLNVPNFVIAVVLTSGGTSLPELMTVVSSVRKGVSNLGIGNLIGASILNIIQVLGISALLYPIPIAAEKSILTFQLPVLIIMALSVLAFVQFSKSRLNKWGGIWLLVLYFIFLSVNIFRESAPFLGPMLF